MIRNSTAVSTPHKTVFIQKDRGLQVPNIHFETLFKDILIYGAHLEDSRKRKRSCHTVIDKIGEILKQEIGTLKMAEGKEILQQSIKNEHARKGLKGKG